MRVRFQADADLDGRIGKGLRRRRPEIDFQLASGVLRDGTLDPDVLLYAANQGRVLVSGDVSTMRTHFFEFTRNHLSPGLILMPRSRGIGQAIQDLEYVWQHWPPQRMRNKLLWPSDLYKHF